MQIFLNKYEENLPKKRTTQYYTYRGIQRVMPLYNSCIRSIIGDGKNTNLWYDTWLN